MVSEFFPDRSPVSIPQWCDCCHSWLDLTDSGLCRFNPTMVRLLPNCYAASHSGKPSFNPTMVRLLPSSSSNLKTFPRFNPTMVRLLLLNELRFLIQGSFNPTMVRLLPAVKFMGDSDTNSFQSHNGAIAAQSASSVPLILYRFQSHNGAIAAGTVWQLTFLGELVSIPQWCDCCKCLQFKYYSL